MKCMYIKCELSSGKGNVIKSMGLNCTRAIMSIMPLSTYIYALFIRYPGNKNNEDSLLNVTYPLILLETEEYVLWYQIIILRQVNIKI